MISVAIVEDDDVIREGVREYLDSQEDMICIAAKSSVERFLAVLNKETRPDVILMDIGLPGMSGISGMKLITEKYPDISVIMFTVYNDSHRIFESLCAGASGYLLKNTAFPEMKEAIEIIHAGGSTMSPPIARKVMSGIRKTSARNCGRCITPASIRVKVCAYSPCPTGPRRISGLTSTCRIFRCPICTWQLNAR